MMKYNKSKRISFSVFVFLTTKLKSLIDEYENNFKNKISKLNYDEKLFFNKIVFYAAISDLSDFMKGRKHGK